MRHPPNPEKQEFIRLPLARNARPGGRSRAEARKYYGGIYHRLSVEERTREVEDGLERERLKARVTMERSGKGRRRAGEDGVEQGRIPGNGEEPNAAEMDRNGVRDVEGKGEEIEDQTAISAAQAVRDDIEAALDGETNAFEHQDAALNGTAGRTDEPTIPDDGRDIAVQAETTVTQEVVINPEALSATGEPDENALAEIGEQATTASVTAAGSEEAVVSEEDILLAAIKQSSESEQESRADREKHNDALPDPVPASVSEEDSAASGKEESSQADENVDLPTPPATSPASAKQQSSTPASPEETVVRFDQTAEQVVSPSELPASAADEDDGYVASVDDDGDQRRDTLETSTQLSAGEETSPSANAARGSQIDPKTLDQEAAIPEQEERGAMITEDRPADRPAEDKHTEGKPAEVVKPTDSQPATDNDSIQPPDPVEKRDIRAIARAFAQEFGQKKTKQATAAQKRQAAAEKQAVAQAAGTRPDIKPKAPEVASKTKGKKKEENEDELFSPEPSDSEEVKIEDKDSDEEGKGNVEKARNEQNNGEREEVKAEDEPEEGDYEHDEFSDDDGEGQDDEGIANTGDPSKYLGDDNNNDDGDFDEMEEYFDNISPDDLSFLPGPSAPVSSTIDPVADTFDSYGSNTFDPYDTYEACPLPKTGEKRKLPHELEEVAPGVAAAFADYQSESFKEDGKEREVRTPDGPPQKRPRLRRPGPQRQEDDDPGIAHATDPPRPAASPVDGDRPAIPQTPTNVAGASGAGDQQAPAPVFSFSSLMKEICGQP